MIIIKMVTILADGVHDVLAILLIMKIDHNDNDKYLRMVGMMRTSL